MSLRFPTVITVEAGIPREHVVSNLRAYRADLVRRSRTQEGQDLAIVKARIEVVDRRLRSLGRRVG
jgi:hypothetical protein